MYHSKPRPRYGTQHVSLAIPNAAVKAVARKLELQGITFEEEVMQDEEIKTLNGVEYCVFPVSIGSTATTWLKDGEETPFKLSKALKGANKDLLADITFKVNLKYRGASGVSKEAAPKTIKLDPLLIQARDICDEALDAAGPVTNAPASPSGPGRDFAASGQLANLLGRQSSKSSRKGRKESEAFPGKGKLLQ